MVDLSSYRVYLFDIDGTLLVSGGAGSKAVFGTFTEDFAVQPADIPKGTSFCGRTDLGILTDMFGVLGIELTESTMTQFYHSYTARLKDELAKQECQPLPMVLETISGLQGAATPSRLGPDRIEAAITIMTGNCRKGAEIKLAAYGLDGYFDLDMGGYGDDFLRRNDLARSTLRSLQGRFDQLKPSEILVIGDTVADIECAHAIGADCLAVATGSFSLDLLAAAKPRYLAESFARVTWQKKKAP